MSNKTFLTDTNLIELLPSPAFILDEGYRLVHMNEAFCEALNRDITDLYNTEPDYWLADPFIGEIFREQLYKYTPFRDTEIEFKGKDEIVTLLLSAFTFYSPSMETGYCCLGVDATAMKNLVLELERARHVAETASMAKSHFLANISHEIRTPLNATMANLELLAKTPLNREQQSLLNEIITGARAHLKVLNAVFDLARLESGRLQVQSKPFRPAELAEALKARFMPVAREKQLTYINRIDPALPEELIGDFDLLFTVLSPLMENAIKFTDTGQVEFSVQLDGHKADGTLHIKFTVRDSGVGIPSHIKNAIFDPFYQADESSTREKGGLGTGLSIARKTIRLMGSELQIFSMPDHGSAFWFVLNMQPSEQEKAPINELITKKPVLIVDDNAINRKVAQKLLAKNGIESDTAIHGAQAVEKVQNSDFACILMDLQMPVMDGFTATRKIRMSNPNLPVIALSANVTTHDRNQAKDSGMQDFLEKPIDETRLLEALAQNIPPTDEDTDSAPLFEL